MISKPPRASAILLTTAAVFVLSAQNLFHDRYAAAQPAAPAPRAGHNSHETALRLLALSDKPPSESLPILREAAGSDESHLRAIAAEVLASTRSIDALGLLFEMQGDRDQHVGETARRAVLWWYDLEEVVAQQCRVMQSDNVDEVLRAIRVIQHWGGPLDLNCLVPALENGQAKIRAAALEAVETRYSIVPRGDERSRISVVKQILSIRP